MTEFMGKKINSFLVIMMLVVLTGMGMLSIYYQQTFKDFNRQYEELAEMQASCQSNLTTTVGTLQTTIRNLNSTESDIRKYDTLYEQKAQELQDTASVLEETQIKLQSETLFKEQFKRKSEQYYSEMQVLQTNVSQLEKQIEVLEFQNAYLDDLVDCMESKPDISEADCYD